MRFKNKEYRKDSCTGSLVKLGEKLWLGTARTNDQNKQRSGYRLGFKMDFDLAERMMELREILP